ncbi:TonB-dependent siderophore receptor [Martelella alba]|uniref:TonB-dependent siderophore receptor n=1 Tax=Martelella alba TaxID=2590451 RepID=A0A506UF27_9HYPH|nr:TonB-dependent siderophore receptor [Martelella alba]TPW31525.1 TonB-dependent siderophore receptor [Martelella alba]
MSISTTKTITFAASASLATLLSAAPLWAQDQDTTELAPVSVIVDGSSDDGADFVAKSSDAAMKTSRPLIETPQSVSVVTRKEFEERNATSVQQALLYSSGVQAELRPNDRYDIVPVRGFGGYQNFVQYLDGLRILKGISYAEPTIDLYNIERVEVVRGPASVLYGQMTPGGMVNLVSKKPTEEARGEVFTTIGNEDYIKSGIDLSGPIDEDGIYRYRFVASGRYNETNIEGVDSSRVSVLPSLEIAPDDATSLTLQFSYTDDPSSNYPGYLPAVGTVLPNGDYPDIPYDFNIGDSDFDKFTRQTTSAGYEFEHEFDDVFTFRQNLRYTHIDTEHRSLYYSGSSGTTLSRGVSHLKEHADTLAVDTQIEADFSTGMLDHTGLFGFDYSYIDANRLFGKGKAPSINYLSPDYSQAITDPAYSTDTNQVTNQAGIYLQDEIAYGALTVALGGRYDYYDITNDSTVLSTGVTSSTENENHAFTGRLGATYLFDNGIAPYASYSTSFEPPSGFGYSAKGGTTLDPVEGEQYEVGVKYQPFDDAKSYIMASAYQLTEKNALSSDPTYSGYYVQTDEIELKGIELEGKLALDSGWDITLAYTYADPEITKSATAALVGNAPAAVPQNAASAWLHYSFFSGPLEGLGIGAGIRYTGETWGDQENSFQVPAYTLFDAGIDYDFGARWPKYEGLTLNVTATNLGNEEYVASCTYTTRCFYGTSRSVYATLKYQW